jgi:hypothetical protein
LSSHEVPRKLLSREWNFDPSRWNVFPPRSGLLVEWIPRYSFSNLVGFSLISVLEIVAPLLDGNQIAVGRLMESICSPLFTTTGKVDEHWWRVYDILHPVALSLTRVSRMLSCRIVALSCVFREGRVLAILWPSWTSVTMTLMLARFTSRIDSFCILAVVVDDILLVGRSIWRWLIDIPALAVVCRLQMVRWLDVSRVGIL